MSILTFLLLALSLANLGLVVVALVRPDGKWNELSPTTLQRPDFSGVVALSSGSLSQLLYLFLLFAWQLHWISFYIGVPINAARNRLSLSWVESWRSRREFAFRH